MIAARMFGIPYLLLKICFMVMYTDMGYIKIMNIHCIQSLVLTVKKRFPWNVEAKDKLFFEVSGNVFYNETSDD